MHFTSCLVALVASSSLAAAIPADSAAKIKAGLRLVKTSETDQGTWVTEEDKISKYVANDTHFIDITDIKDEEVLARLSTPPKELSSVDAAVVDYSTELTHQTEAKALIANMTTTHLESWLKTLTGFYNRYYLSAYGKDAEKWLKYEIGNIVASNPDIVVTKFEHDYPQNTIIVRIPGISPNLAVVGAHFDSTGGSSTERGPGADDNGSGVVALLEALRVFASSGYTPKNTLEFHFYSGEEGGLLGSQDVWASYKKAGKKVLAFLNQDMAGYSPNGELTVIRDYVDAALTGYVEGIARHYEWAYTIDKCGFACSDHASANANGFPAAFVVDEPFKTSDQKIHTPSDSYDTVSFDTILRHARLTAAFLLEASYLQPRDVRKRFVVSS